MVKRGVPLSPARKSLVSKLGTALALRQQRLRQQRKASKQVGCTLNYKAAEASLSRTCIEGRFKTCSFRQGAKVCHVTRSSDVCL